MGKVCLDSRLGINEAQDEMVANECDNSCDLGPILNPPDNVDTELIEYSAKQLACCAHSYRLRILNRLKDVPVIPEFTFMAQERMKEHGVIDVGVGEVAFSENTPLYTEGLYPCVGVAIVNSDTGQALLLHASSYQEVDRYLDSSIERLGLGHLTAVIAGGNRTLLSDYTMFRILEVLDSKSVELVGYRPNELVDSLAIDPSTGTFY